ncbi:MAG: M50 family metallopeptidase, partial [Planctomycetaceae bacterium]|nr:M50 family metallopeptidase [Planctomycetaceae bacterium]
MDILSAIWTVTYGVLLIILGFNALIIVHEFGHFIVARLCGVRCEKFYIWFDFWGLRFFRFKWGDTEYGLGLFPLGGYVKMLGQEDDPGALRAEIERAKMQAESPHPSPPPEGEGTLVAPPPKGEGTLPPSIFAPDSYLSKSVPQRLAIIVAGVIMNFLFAIVCAAGAYMIGVKEATPAVGNVIPGSPAWQAGLQSGDRITAIDGKPAKTFQDVIGKMVGRSKNVQLTIDRKNEPLTIDVAPRKRKCDLARNIGVASLPILEIFKDEKHFPCAVYPAWEKYYSAE